jgi:GNAT superfamily N-acetyltransferase
VRNFIALQTKLFPTVDLYAATAFDRCFPPIEKALFADKKPQEWWYLSTLAVHPSYQGHGLGGLLMDEGLGLADAYQQKKQKSGKGGDETPRGKVWLIGLSGTDRFYTRFGFKEVGRANVGELSEWDGGIVMFRE